MKLSRALRSFLCIASSVLFTISYADAASATWDGSTDQTWAKGTNWSGDAAPGATTGITIADVATFGTTGSGAITVDANRNIKGIDFNGNSSVFTLNSGNILLTNGGTIQTSGGGSGHTDTINTAIALQGDGGNATFTAGSSTAARLLVIGSGGVTGVSTGSNVTTLTLNGTNTGNNAVSGIIGDGSGGGKLALTKSDSGSWNLSGDNTYTGTTAINTGILKISHDNALGSTAGNTTIFATGNTTAGGVLALSGGINSAENITITGGGEIASNNSYGRIIDNTSGNNTLSGDITLADNTSAIRLGAEAGQLTFAGNISQNTSTVSLRFQAFGSSTVIVDKAINNNGGNMQIYSTASSGTGSVTLKGVSGSGIGATTVSQNATLKLGVTNALNTIADLRLGATGSNDNDIATFDLAGFDQTVNALNGLVANNAPNSNRKVTNSASTGTNTLTVGNGDGTGIFNGVIVDGTTAKVALTKTGNGTQTLNGTNTYTGATTVSAGKLVVNESIGLSAVTVSGVDTVLATDAAASFGSTLTIGAGAILAPGDAGVAGTATVTRATTFDNGSIFSWDISSDGQSYDKLVTARLAGESTTGDAVLRIVVADTSFSDSFWTNTQTWTDLFTDGTAPITDWAGIFGNNVSVVDSSFTPSTPTVGSFSISGNTLTWTAVPEPTSALIGLLLTAGLLRRRRA